MIILILIHENNIDNDGWTCLQRRPPNRQRSSWRNRAWDWRRIWWPGSAAFAWQLCPWRLWSSRPRPCECASAETRTSRCPIPLKATHKQYTLATQLSVFQLRQSQGQFDSERVRNIQVQVMGSADYFAVGIQIATVIMSEITVCVRNREILCHDWIGINCKYIQVYVNYRFNFINQLCNYQCGLLNLFRFWIAQQKIDLATQKQAQTG